MSRIRVVDMSYNYGDGTPALNRVNLDFDPTHHTALVGPNGAGKTSLLMALAGLIDAEGEVLINEIHLENKTKEKLRTEMSFVFQNPDDMLFMPTVEEDVAFGLDTLGLTDSQVREHTAEALSKVSLSGFEQRSAHHLSYGERRKVCLATALARQTSITLFDEPTRELDPQGRRNFIKLFNEMEGILILATHDLELVLETCSKMVLLDEGNV
ncbi:MAG: energy-coupling factor ABC transporter ATP-binding protein, partial [Candidatus Marinimicrobia bacterium]|nr:energy-coupling factor ABC transporter ATP-binding protein [Candidatus Neomarinimicrobiota bacterium]